MAREFPRTNDQKFDSAVRALSRGEAGQALRIAKELIDDGYFHAYTIAGAACEKGDIDLTRNLEQALSYYQQAVAKCGAVEAWLALGRMYYFGRGIEPDYERAHGCYATVYDETRNGLAAMMLARCYYEGKGVPADKGRAIRYLKEAIEQGFAFAATQLASIEYRDGKYGMALVHWLQGLWRAIRLRRGDPRLRPY